jgi:hypothetical protein
MWTYRETRQRFSTHDTTSTVAVAVWPNPPLFLPLRPLSASTNFWIIINPLKNLTKKSLTKESQIWLGFFMDETYRSMHWPSFLQWEKSFLSRTKNIFSGIQVLFLFLLTLQLRLSWDSDYTLHPYQLDSTLVEQNFIASLLGMDSSSIY